MINESPDRKILNVLFSSTSEEFSYRELSRKTGVSIATISSAVARLVAMGLLIVRILGKSNIVALNRESQKAIYMKRAYNLESIYSCGLVDFLRGQLRPNAIVLFGSYSFGQDSGHSDIDVAVVGGRLVVPDLVKFERLLGKKINITSVKSYEKSTKEFLNVLANGIVLDGYLEAAR